ncbi:MAG: hypothetical protein MMC23_007335 [Stictis urceolatum]|nr:hypothetical protein [Stictis urceolata]
MTSGADALIIGDSTMALANPGTATERIIKAVWSALMAETVTRSGNTETEEAGTVTNFGMSSVQIGEGQEAEDSEKSGTGNEEALRTDNVKDSSGAERIASRKLGWWVGFGVMIVYVVL